MISIAEFSENIQIERMTKFKLSQILEKGGTVPKFHATVAFRPECGWSPVSGSPSDGIFITDMSRIIVTELVFVFPEDPSHTYLLPMVEHLEVIETVDYQSLTAKNVDIRTYKVHQIDVDIEQVTRID